MSRTVEPSIASVFVAEDGRVFRNRPRLEAVIERLRGSERYSYLYRMLEDNLVGGRFQVVTNAQGFATALEYEVEDLTEKGRFYSKKRVSFNN